MLKRVLSGRVEEITEAILALEKVEPASGS